MLPAFTNIPLAAIDTLQIREWLARLAASGLSNSRMRSAKQVLAQVLGSAVEGSLLVRNVAEGVKVKQGPRNQIHHYLTAAQVEMLAAATDPRCATLVRFAAYSGLRAGEIAALKVGRVNLLAGTVEVVEQATEIAGKVTWGRPRRRSAER